MRHQLLNLVVAIILLFMLWVVIGGTKAFGQTQNSLTIYCFPDTLQSMIMDGWEPVHSLTSIPSLPTAEFTLWANAADTGWRLTFRVVNDGVFCQVGQGTDSDLEKVGP